MSYRVVYQIYLLFLQRFFNYLNLLNIMEIQLQKSAFVLPKEVDKNKLDLYCNKYMELWSWNFCFPNCMSQSIFICIPKGKDGVLLDFKFAFKSLQMAMQFRDRYKVHHEGMFWKKQVNRLNSVSLMMYLAWRSRFEFETL